MFAFAILGLLAALLPQEPTEVVARFQLEGQPATVTRTDLALEMAFHLRRRDQGQEACEQLVDTWVTRLAATKAGVLPGEAEVRAFWRELQDQLRAAGRRPEEFAAVRNSGEAQWLADLAVQMAQERLVRRELALGANERVSGEMMKLWLQEQRKRSKIVTDPDQLPGGVAARIDDQEVPLLDLGLLLLRTSEDDQRDRFVQQVVYLQTLERKASAAGIAPTAADLDAALAAQRAEAARDPRFRGASFEQLLRTQGLTPAALRSSRVFRAKVLLDLLSRKLHPDTALRDELQRDRAAVQAQVGARRRLGVVFVRALAEPNALVPRTFAAAEQHLETVRQRLQKEAFDHVARVETEDPAGKARGGDLGWFQRRSEQLPDALLAAAFAAADGELTPTVRGPDGCYLAKVLEVEPEPDDELLLRRLREARAQQLSQQLLRDAKVELVAAAGGAEARK